VNPCIEQLRGIIPGERRRPLLSGFSLADRGAFCPLGLDDTLTAPAGTIARLESCGLVLLCACWLGLLLPPGGAAAMDAAEALDLARLAAPKLEGAGLPRLTPEVVSIPCMQRTRQVLAGPGIANT
jgi:hypothetical protein